MWLLAAVYLGSAALLLLIICIETPYTPSGHDGGVTDPIDFESSPFEWQELEESCTCPDWPVTSDDECPEHNQAWRR